MKIDKRALGRGLSALISDNHSIPSLNTTDAPAPQSLQVNRITTNPYQPRKEFKEEELNELAGSIKEYGVLQPILVREYNGHYQIIAGERRWQASKLAGLTEIPAIVKDFNDAEMLEVALIENIQRENLNSIEEAEAYKKLVEDYGLTQEQVSKKIGRSRSYIANTMRLLTLPAEIRDMVLSGKITAGHARSLIGKGNAVEIANRIINDNLSVRNAESISKNRPEHTVYSPYANIPPDNELTKIAALLSEALGMNIFIQDGHRGGRLTIQFTTLDQLDHIIKLLGGRGMDF